MTINERISKLEEDVENLKEIINKRLELPIIDARIDDISFKLQEIEDRKKNILALSKGSLHGTVNVMEDMKMCERTHDREIEQMQKDLHDLFNKFIFLANKLKEIIEKNKWLI